MPPRLDCRRKLDTRNVSLSVPPTPMSAQPPDIRPFPPAPPRHSLTGTNGRSTVANQTGRPIAPARKLVAAVLGTIAVFVMVFGLGLSSWAIVALGAALLALSIALGMVNVVRRGARAWVTGTARSRPSRSRRCRPRTAAPNCRSWWSRRACRPPRCWSATRGSRSASGRGSATPCRSRVDVDDMRRVRIDWDEAGDRSDDGDPPPPPILRAGRRLPRRRPAGRRRTAAVDHPRPPVGPRPRGAASAAAGDYADETTDETSALQDSPVVVHDTPAGPVLEGQFVDHDETPSPLPRRPDLRAGRAAAGRVKTEPTSAPSGFGGGRSHRDGRSRDRPAGTDTAATEAATDSASTTTPEQSATDGQDPAGPWSDPPTQESTASYDQEPDAYDPDAPSAGTRRPTTPHPRAPPTSAAEKRSTTTRRSTCRWTATPSPTPSCPPRRRTAVDEGIIAPPAADDRPGSGEPAGRPQAGGGRSVPEARSAPEDQPTFSMPPASVPEARSAPDDLPPPQAPPTITGLDTASVADDRPGADGPDITEPIQTDATPPTAGPPLLTPMRCPRTPATDGRGPHAPSDADPTADSVRPTPSAAETSSADAHEAPSGAGEGRAQCVRQDGRRRRRSRRRRSRSRRRAPQDEGRGQPAPDQRGPWSDLEGGYEPDDRADDLITAYPSARPGPAGAIHGVGITVLVTDLDRSIAFYRDTLGFFEIDSGTAARCWRPATPAWCCAPSTTCPSDTAA